SVSCLYVLSGAIGVAALRSSFMMIDDDTLKELLRINDELLQLCKFLNEKHDMETSSCLIALVDDLTHILIEAGKEQITLMQQDKDISSRCGALPGSPTELNGQSTTNAPVPSVIIAK